MSAPDLPEGAEVKAMVRPCVSASCFEEADGA
jgi:hypothetical protein